jgi:hypothetical protein
VIEPGREAPDDRPSRYARPATPAAQESRPATRKDESPLARESRPAARRASPGAAGGARRPSREEPSGTRRSAAATIFRLAALPAAAAIVATIALVAALASLEGARTLAFNSWLMAIGGLVLWTCWRALTQALPTASSTAFDSVRRRPAESPSRLSGVIAIEGVVLDAEWSWAGVEHGLRPLLRRLAATRLMERHHVDMESEPVAAHRILGDELWALVGPGAYGPAEAAAAPVMLDNTAQADAEIVVGPAIDRTKPHPGRGIQRAIIRRAIEALEEL